MTEPAAHPASEGGLQRRQNTRFTCDGKAELFLTESGAIMLGELGDMSSGGCMILTHARTAVEPGMTANLFFMVRGKQYRIASTVRNVRPGRRIGLQFHFDSESHRAEYNQLFYDITD